MDDFDNVAPALTPGAGQLFMPRTQRQALAELVRAILAGEPFVALTGKPGVGKTTVLNTAVAVLAERGLRVRRIDNPHGTPLRLPQIIGELLGNPPGAVTNADIERLFDALTLNNDGSQLVLVFDDAHYLQADVLGYLQIVSSLHALGIRNQQVIFAGRPEFWGLLEDPKLCDLDERIKARPVIEPLGEAEARDFLYYRLEQMYGPIRQQVSDAALSRLVQHGDGIPGRLDPILLKSLVAAGGYRLLGPETVDAGAYALASGAPSVVVPTAPEKSSGQMVASHPPPAPIPRLPERRHLVFHPGALVCLAVLLAGGIGTAWHSSVQSNPREIGGGTTASSTTLPEPPTQTAIMLAAASPADASAASQMAPTATADPPAPATPAQVTSSRVDTPVVPPVPMPVAQQQPAAGYTADNSAPASAASQEEASPAAGPSSSGAAVTSGQDMSSPPQRAGDAPMAPDASSPAPGPSRSAEGDAQTAQPQSSPVAPATAPPATPSIAAAAAVPQPPVAAAPVAAPRPAPASPPATDVAVPSQPPPVSPASPAGTATAVATQTTGLIDGQAQRPNAPSATATTPSATASSPSTDAIPRAAESDHPPPAPAAGPEVPISPAATGPAVLATQRHIVPGSVAASPAATTEPPKTETTAPAAPPAAVPAHLETSAPPAADTSTRPAPSPQSAPTDTQAAPQPASLPPDIVADLLRRGDAMLALGDISSARLLYGRAAESGEARATTQLAKTYDPLFLAKIGAFGIPTDATTAAELYRRAASLGDAEATERLKRLAEAGQ